MDSSKTRRKVPAARFPAKEDTDLTSLLALYSGMAREKQNRKITLAIPERAFPAAPPKLAAAISSLLPAEFNSYDALADTIDKKLNALPKERDRVSLLGKWHSILVHAFLKGNRELALASLGRLATSDLARRPVVHRLIAMILESDEPTALLLISIAADVVDPRVNGLLINALVRKRAALPKGKDHQRALLLHALHEFNASSEPEKKGS